MKYKIEKNTVQETLILPLYSRKLCTELYPNLYRDETAVHLIDQIDYDFSETEKNSRSLIQRFEMCIRDRYVVVEELIPEMSQGQHSNVGTMFFAVGFSVMMVLDVALG